MNKSQFYLSQCADAASKSTMYYNLGSVIVKGGKVISRGCNHQRPNYDMPGKGTPVSMHAEMASIYNATRGRAPAPKQQISQHNKYTEKPVRYEEEYGRNLESRRNPSGVPYRAKKPRRAFYPTPHYQGQGQEAGPAYEEGPGSTPARTGARKSRARYSKLNGCDLYVCRITKNGEFGCSKPCWRCVDWCWWAGIKRIFHWSAVEGRFICLKVGDVCKAECYETATELRLLNGRVSSS
ncbi:hypothetical protein B0H16DRAFT_1731014 [Mycena metata]|uniref:CMP/dCMP-type deaminase domain-containing protein n=1 Tax=Mycena metata TaxID=1033252 RepID=A0AAD7I627_9AGAR|nr:hypothetical protein B0H16DRAFT_1731014 [Mycena metata]